MHPSYAASRGLSILIGTTCLGLECWLIGDHVLRLEGGWTPLAAAAVALPVALSGIAPLAEAALRQRQYLKAAGFILLFVTGLAYCLSQSIDRSGAARDGRVAQATASNTRYQTAKEDRGLALDAVEDAALATLQLCRPGQSKSACREARIAETAARERLALASQAYVAAGAPVVADVLATRLVLVAHLAGVTLKPEHVTMIQPMLAPLFLQLGSVVAFAFGFAPVVRRWRDVSRRSSRGPVVIDVKARDVSRHVSRGVPRLSANFRTQSPKSQGADLDRVLAVIAALPAPVSNVELARLLGTTTASASRWTSQLVDQGQVSREKAGRCVAIVAKGRARG